MDPGEGGVLCVLSVSKNNNLSTHSSPLGKWGCRNEINNDVKIMNNNTNS